MSNKEISKYLKDFVDYKDKVTSSKEESLKFLVDSGIYTSKGELSRNYK
jgi:hypothetical protein